MDTDLHEGTDERLAGEPTGLGEAERGTVLESPLPDAVEAVRKDGEVTEQQVVDATDWLFATEDEGEPDYVPTAVRVDIGNGRVIEWLLRPLTGDEFDKARQLSMGSRRDQQKKISQGRLAELVNEREYHAYIVAFATVSPDLLEASRRKSTAPHEIVKHRFRYKPGYIAELAATVNDISGYDPTKVEVVADAVGNS